ncbi:hypothetical protein NDU88_009977 [Pleurodeles waltl]|uniref:Uncharacterized protein n=1 Tax=Pleurodeles waltl TaxID=8319 RepID=A0AAV7QW66_PLEWA|nr:hypothetical protein NDU88_009977 [Pleurodeles waltl]
MLHAGLNSGGPCCVLVGLGPTVHTTPAAPCRLIPQRGCSQPVNPATTILSTCPGSSNPHPQSRKARCRRVHLSSLHSCGPLHADRGSAQARSVPV